MAIKTIKKLLEKHLSLMTPPISTAYENTNFKPVDGQPYQRVQVTPLSPDNPTLGDDYYRERGEFQVFLAYPVNKGAADALLRAEAVQTHFKRGTVLQEGNIRLHILKTPTVSGSIISGDRYVVPVIIQYEAEVIPL